MVRENSNMKILIATVTALQTSGEVMYAHFLKA